MLGDTFNKILFSTLQSDELSLQKKLRTEVIQLEDTLAQVRKEYEMLRIEFEQNLAANEQAGTLKPSPVSKSLKEDGKTCYNVLYLCIFILEDGVFLVVEGLRNLIVQIFFPALILSNTHTASEVSKWKRCCSFT